MQFPQNYKALFISFFSRGGFRKVKYCAFDALSVTLENKLDYGIRNMFISIQQCLQISFFAKRYYSYF